jgi:hypothetical protein
MSVSTVILNEDLSLGVLDGSPEYMFDQISSILPTSNGEVLVLDGGIPIGVPMLRRYDSNGAYLGSVAGRGDGPGEFQHPYALAELRDGRVLLRDAQLTNRISIYALDGTLDTTWVVDGLTSSTPGAPFPALVDTNGIVWLRLGGS